MDLQVDLQVNSAANAGRFAQRCGGRVNTYAPMFPRLPDRIRAHAQICFIALVLHRVMRMRLKAASNKNSPERALELLRQLKRHRIHLSDDQTVIGLSSVSAEQAELFTSLKLPKPTAKNI